MSNTQLRLADGVHVAPMYGDIDVDCRLLFIGDRYRQLLRAYAEAIFRLSRSRPMAERDAYLRASAEVAQYYEVTTTPEKIALRMRDEFFAMQAPLDELELHLVASRGTGEVSVPLSIEQLQTAGVLLPLVVRGGSEHDIHMALSRALAGDAREWAQDVLARWLDAGFVERTAETRPNPFEAPFDGPRVTFMGHTSIMLQSGKTRVLTDPLFRVGLGVPPVAFDAMRLRLDAICCTHSHWDHCDLATLLHFDKETPIVIPRVRKPTAFNPPMVQALQWLGFRDIRELDVWDTIKIGDIEMTTVPFHGEQDEPDAEIDHYTYVFRMAGLCVYGGVDAYRDTFGEMLPALERVRREWKPDLAFLPISRMRYHWRHGGVNGFCRAVDTDLLDKSFQYTAGADQAIEWAETLGVKRVAPYATFNFSPFDVPAQSREFDEALVSAGRSQLLLPLRPFDSAGPADLTDASQAAMRRRYLLTVLRAGATAKRLDRRLKNNLGYRLVKRVIQGRAPRPAAHHH
jgi:L-ascorbate metabolism protein UlaG (beta-lactamase superfamily)